MTRALAPIMPAPLTQLLEHVTVSYLGTHKIYPQLIELAFECQVGHQGADHSGYFLTEHTIAYDHVEQFIAVINTASPIDHLQAILNNITSKTTIIAVW